MGRRVDSEHHLIHTAAFISDERTHTHITLALRTVTFFYWSFYWNVLSCYKCKVRIFILHFMPVKYNPTSFTDIKPRFYGRCIRNLRNFIYGWRANIHDEEYTTFGHIVATDGIKGKIDDKMQEWEHMTALINCNSNSWRRFISLFIFTSNFHHVDLVSQNWGPTLSFFVVNYACKWLWFKLFSHSKRRYKSVPVAYLIHLAGS